MSSGGKKIFWNTRERVVSSDFNREANLIDAEVVNVLRHLFDPSSSLNNFEFGAGVGQLSTTVGTPLRGHVLSGLMVTVPIAGTELNVTPGAVVFIDPDGQAGSSDPAAPNPDDSVAKLAIDPVGILAGGGDLVLTQNVSGSLRVDVVEIRRIPNLVLEADSRDIFDPSTGTFAPVTVNKVVASGIQYRIRTGTPGGGMPAHVQGWLPIAVISVPDTTVTWDTCIFYDVRPLVSDRANSVLSEVFESAPATKRDLWTDTTTVPAEFRLAGVCETTCMGYRMGGEFLDFLDLNDTALYDPALVLVANQLLAVHLLFPFGLPRWVKYSGVAIPPFATRVPLFPRGIPVVSDKVSIENHGTLPGVPATGAPAGIGFPPSAGLGTGTTTANDREASRILTYVARDSANTIFLPFFVKDGRLHLAFPLPLGVVIPVSFGGVGFADTALITKRTQLPKEAKAVLLFGNTTIGTAGPPATIIRYRYTPKFMAIQPGDVAPAYWDEGDSGDVVFAWGTGNPLAVPGYELVRRQKWVDAPRDFLTNSNTLRISLNWGETTVLGSTATLDRTASTAVILGWEI